VVEGGAGGRESENEIKGEGGREGGAHPLISSMKASSTLGLSRDTVAPQVFIYREGGREGGR